MQHEAFPTSCYGLVGKYVLCWWLCHAIRDLLRPMSLGVKKMRLCQVMARRRHRP